MTLTNAMNRQFHRPEGTAGKVIGFLMATKRREYTEWLIDQLRIQPYQYLLEVGYGSGATLEEVVRRLRIGFIAGTDHSVEMYKMAFARNKKAIQQQLLHLHLGAIDELPYPHNYFHTVYGTNVHAYLKDPVNQFIQLYQLLRPGGKMVIQFQPNATVTNMGINLSAGKIETQIRQAGFKRVEINIKGMNPLSCISMTGFK